MAWVKLDDAILDNPKIVAVGAEGLVFHVAAITWCGRNLSDGLIPKSRARLLLDATTLASTADEIIARLAAGDNPLWHDRGDRWEIHDYLDYNPTREEVERLRRERAEAGRIGGRRSAEGKRAKQVLKQVLEHQLEQNASTCSSKTQANSNPVPVPEEEPSASRAVLTRTRASAPARSILVGLEERALFPDDLQLTADMRRRIAEVGCTAPAAEFTAWRATARQKRTYAADWPGAAWDTWVARHAQFGCAGGAPARSQRRSDPQPARPGPPSAQATRARLKAQQEGERTPEEQEATRRFLAERGILPGLKDIPG